ncbi:MAG: alkaline phosphatase PhoX [Rhodospirillales bacterium]
MAGNSERPTAAEDVDVATLWKSMVDGRGGYGTEPLLTIGESVAGSGAFTGQAGSYTPVGIPDGLGAYKVDDDTVRVFMNHEIGEGGAPYTVNNGVDGSKPLSLTGARISYFDIDAETKGIEDAGIAYNKIYGIDGKLITSIEQFGETAAGGEDGFTRFCSASLFEPGTFGPGTGFTDRVYFAGEETDDGVFYALDVANGEMHAAPMLGRGNWENLTLVDTGDPDQVGLLLGDDVQENLLYLYVGEKGAAGDGSFLDRNGLAKGQLHVWAADERDIGTGLYTDPTTFNAQGASLDGSFVPIVSYDASKAGTDGYDQFGYALQDTLKAQGADIGAMEFVRVEDLATNPANGGSVAFNVTGRSGIYGDADQLGSTMLADLDFSDPAAPKAKLSILYDGDGDRNATLRSPDNIDWADNGYIYAQEDRASDVWDALANQNEASIIRLLPDVSKPDPVRVAEIDRSAVVPAGTTDAEADELGAWETSGILDVSELFGKPGGSLFLYDVQAHGIADGPIAEQQLVEGGQLGYLIGSDAVDDFALLV